jgi:hypothetical protein
MEFEVGQVIKTENTNYLLVNIDEKNDLLHLYGIKEKKVVYCILSLAELYGILSLVENENQLLTNINILSIIPKEQVFIVKIP